MNIWLPIITNLVLVACFLFDFLFNKKLGLKFTLIKFGVVICAGVGSYFLTPFILQALPQISIIAQLGAIWQGLFVASTFAIVIDLLLSLIFYIAYKIKNKEKSIKVKRAKATNRKLDRQLKRDERREARRARRLARKTAEKKQKINRVFTIIVSLLFALVLNVLVSIELNSITTLVGEQYTVEYEYTAYGQIDNLINKK